MTLNAFNWYHTQILNSERQMLQPMSRQQAPSFGASNSHSNSNHYNHRILTMLNNRPANPDRRPSYNASDRSKPYPKITMNTLNQKKGKGPYTNH